MSTQRYIGVLSGANKSACQCAKDFYHPQGLPGQVQAACSAPILFVAPSLRGDLFDNVLLTRLCAGLYALPAWRRMRGEADPSVSAPELTPTHMWRAILRCSLANTDWWGMDGDSLFVACKEDLEERDQNRGRCLGSTNCSKVRLAFLLPTRGLHVNCGSGPICTLHRRDLGGAMQLYTGRLCQRCNFGYYPWFGKCLECPDRFGWAASNVGTVNPPPRFLSPLPRRPFGIHGRVSALHQVIYRYGTIWLLWILVNRFLCEQLQMADAFLNFAQIAGKTNK